MNPSEFKQYQDWTLPQPVKSKSVRGGPGGTGILKLPEDSSTGVRIAGRGRHSPRVWDFSWLSLKGFSSCVQSAFVKYLLCASHCSGHPDPALSKADGAQGGAVTGHGVAGRGGWGEGYHAGSEEDPGRGLRWDRGTAGPRGS